MKAKQNEHPATTETVQSLRGRLQLSTDTRKDYRPGPIVTDPSDPLFGKSYSEIAIVADGHTPADNLEDKDTNPKDVLAANKLPLSVVPDTLVIYATLAFLEGALKYGRYNWRIAGVRNSIYLDALKRHIAAYENGEDLDPNTKVPHLSNALACIGIILDAKEVGKLNDDRPPRASIGDLIRKMEADVIRLKALFIDHHPHQYTIKDGQEGV